MSWVKLDDGFITNRKVQAVSPLAAFLDVAAFCFCAQSENDGQFTKDAAYATAALARVRPAKRLIAELVAAGLWEEDANGYRIHDYLEYNPSHDQLEAERKRKREWKAGHSRPSSSASTGQSTRPESSASGSNVPSPSLSGSSSLPEADPDRSKPCARIRPREAHELILCLKIAVEREQPERGMWAAEPFGHKNAQDFLRGFGDDLEAALSTIEQRIVLFAKDPEMRPWTVRKFAEQYNAIGLPRAGRQLSAEADPTRGHFRATSEQPKATGRVLLP